MSVYTSPQRETISKKPNLLLDYILTDCAEYIPYFMTVAFSDLHLGIGEPKFFSFDKKTSYHYHWGYVRPSAAVTLLHSHTQRPRWWGNNNGDPTKMGYMSKYQGIELFMNSLFMMQTERGASNILLIGVVKEEDAVTVKNIYTTHINDDMLSDFDMYIKIIPYIEIWVADDFDIPRSLFPQARLFYRRAVRKELIENGIRIKKKPRAELNAFLIKRNVQFQTIDSLHTKINTLCQKAAKTNTG